MPWRSPPDRALPPSKCSLQYVSSNFFQGLGVLPVLGRPFRDDEDRVGGEPVVIVSHRFWMSRLGGGDDALDRSVRINNVAARIVGVAPPGFFGLRAGPVARRLRTARDESGLPAESERGGPRGEDDRNWWVRQVGRLKPGVSEAAARSADRRPVPQHAGSRRHGRAKIPELVTLPGRRGFDALNARDTRALWILMLLVGVLLLIVCANVANLLLSRSVGRQRESAVRLALGAARTRLFRQHLIESGVLALLGGAAGLALGYVLAQSIHAAVSDGPRCEQRLRPSYRSARPRIQRRALDPDGAALRSRAGRARLARRPRRHAQGADQIGDGRPSAPAPAPGLDPDRAVPGGVGGGRACWAELARELEMDGCRVRPRQPGVRVREPRHAPDIRPSARGPYIDRVREELARLPGVVSVSPVSTRLLSGGGNNGRVNFPGRPWDDASRSNLNTVGDGFFETLRIPLVAGRTFERRDMQPDADAVVVDQAFAAAVLPERESAGPPLWTRSATTTINTRSSASWATASTAACAATRIRPSTNPIVRGARSTSRSARRWTPALSQKLFDRRSRLSIRRSRSQSFIPRPG